MSVESNIRVSVDQLCAGECGFDVYDENGVLLLGAGSTLSDSRIASIRERGLEHVVLHPDDVAGISRKSAAPEKPKSSASPKSQLSFAQQRRDRCNEPYSSERLQRFAKTISGTMELLGKLGRRVSSLSNVEIAELAKVPDQLVDMVIEDADQAIMAALESETGTCLPSRCSQMCLLSINTGLEMGLDDGEIATLGLAALAHDIGLYFLPKTLQDPSVALTKEQAWEFRRHPSIISDALKNFSDIPDEVVMVVRQVHERLDGSGYPDGLMKNLIHPLAKILNVVDSYLMLTKPGPGRPPIVPHDAISFLLVQGTRGLFDAEVLRAFLTQISLFPIGSRVQLDNGELATVIRRDGKHYASPVVHLQETPDRSVLAINGSSRSIARPIASRTRKEMRVTTEMAESLTMSMMEPAY